VGIADYKQTPLSEVKARFAEAAYDPTLLIQASLETLEGVTNGEALLLDPTHPAVVILEMGAVEAANSVQETIGVLRKQYPSLAESEEDLYRHMSDKDYVNRFASPSKTTLNVGILMNSLISKMVKDESEGCWKATIPRDTTITVDGVAFTLCYPVTIRRYQSGAWQVSYDPTIPSPVQTLSKVVITASVRTSNNNENWMFFEVEVVQLQHDTFTAILEQIHNYKKSFAFLDNFHYARAFYRNTATGSKWVELKTTHTDQVFDSRTPTVLFKVVGSELEVRIPIIYFTNGSLSGELRVDIYTTKGELNMNLQNFGHELYGANLKPIDEERDYNVYVDAFANSTYVVFGNGITSGGKAALSFEKLRERVIFNSIGEQVLPITNVALTADAENSAYDIVRDVDVVTNRAYLATRKLPPPSNPKLITAANIGMATFAGTLAEIESSPSVVRGLQRVTMKSKTLFKRENGKLSILPKASIDWLQALGQNQFVSELNSSEYLFTPLHYVLDETGDEFELRAYSLDLPEGADLNYVSLNQSLQMFVNTASFSFEKVSNGYRLSIVTNSGTYFKDAEDSHVGVQLAFNPNGETTYAYINGNYVGRNANNERVYDFFIETNHDIDSSDLICITNAKVQGVDGYHAWIKLTTMFHILYYTSLVTTNFEADKTDQMLGKWLLPTGSVGNSHETLSLELGKPLSSLWRRAHSYLHDTVYRTYDHDIPMVYEQDTYDVDPITNSVFKIVNGEVVYNTLHKKGDPVLDADGKQVYLHRKGDVILDSTLTPMKIENVTIGREIDLLLCDARYYFADDDATKSYLEELESTIASWVYVDMEDLNKDLLDKTKIFFYPKTNIGEVVAYYESEQEVRINSEQEFNLTLYVPDDIFRDEKIRADIETRVTKLLDAYIDRTVVNMTEIREELKVTFGNSVSAFQISGLGGSANYEVLRMKDDRYRLSLKKNIVVRPDKRTYVKDAVNIEFKRTAA